MQENFCCKLVSSMEKVFPIKEPKETKGHFTGFKGENVSFQIAYFWRGKNKSIGEIDRIEVREDQVKEEGEPFCKTDIRVRKVLPVPCMYTNHEETDEDYLVTGPGMYPDLLREIDTMGFGMIARQWGSLWVDCSIPTNAKAGTYRITFFLKTHEKADKKESFCEKKEVLLEIVDAVLPELAIPHTEWFHCDCLADFYDVPVFGKEHFGIIENFVKAAVRRNCNMLYTPVFTPPLDTAVGGERRTIQLVDVILEDDAPKTDSRYSFDFEKLEQWIRMGERCKIKYYEISHLFTQWGAEHAPKIMAMVKGEEKRIFGWETKADNEEYRNFLGQFLKALDKKLQELGIKKRVYFHISDEPGKEQLASYRSAKEMVKKYLKDYPVIDAISNYEFYENGLIEEPICASDYIMEFLKEDKRPKKLWTYYCTAQSLKVSNRFIAMPGARTRILGVMLYKYQINGFLHWGYNFYNSQYSLYPIDPYKTTDADGAFPAGDPFLVYPGKGGIPEESVRMMLMDEAFLDYRALKLLEELTDRKTALQCLEEETYGELTFEQYPKGQEYIQKVRENICEKVKEVNASR